MSGHVLLVEDNAPLRENLADLLTSAKREVRACGNIGEVDALARNWVQVAIIDVHLPDGNGMELAQKIKSLEPDCEIILLTGHASVESAAHAVKRGIWAYMVKPFSTPDLLRMVDQALRHVQSQWEKRALEQRTQVAEKLAAVGTMTAGLSHEIRNPLNAASLQLSVLERRLRKLPAEAQPRLLEPLTLVRDEIKRLDHILADFLQFARPASFVPRTVALREVVEKVVAVLSVAAQQKGVQLEVAEHWTALVPGDAGRLQQAIMNLLLNAIDAAPSGGRVGIGAEAGARQVHLWIEDDGPGIPDEVAARIFEPFFTTKAKGSGLGLPIANAVIAQHGGNIRIERAQRGGARFVLSLPTSLSDA